MTVAAAAGFSLAMTVLAASPGPGVFGVVGRSLSSGVGKTIFMIAGIVTGDLIYLIFAIFGLTYAAQKLSGLFERFAHNSLQS
jgi:threonine/homoserine/homoserine lactone efflux protein